VFVQESAQYSYLPRIRAGNYGNSHTTGLPPR